MKNRIFFCKVLINLAFLFLLNAKAYSEDYSNNVDVNVNYTGYNPNAYFCLYYPNSPECMVGGIYYMPQGYGYYPYNYWGYGGSYRFGNYRDGRYYRYGYDRYDRDKYKNRDFRRDNNRNNRIGRDFNGGRRMDSSSGRSRSGGRGGRR